MGTKIESINNPGLAQNQLRRRIVGGILMIGSFIAGGQVGDDYISGIGINNSLKIAGAKTVNEHINPLGIPEVNTVIEEVVRERALAKLNEEIQIEKEFDALGVDISSSNSSKLTRTEFSDRVFINTNADFFNSNDVPELDDEDTLDHPRMLEVEAGSCIKLPALFNDYRTVYAISDAPKPGDATISYDPWSRVKVCNNRKQYHDALGNDLIDPMQIVVQYGPEVK